ncbi:MAG: hypothetical protein AB7P17_00560 [Nitrospirales bacterium]|nr:hypothetical protein [Nitrospirales bacterium]
MARSRHPVCTVYALLVIFLLMVLPLSMAWGDEKVDPLVTSPANKTTTVVADLLMVDGSFYVVRGDRGEIRIEVTPETQLSESFKFGDRIKAVLLPNDEALSITRAMPGEPTGITQNSPAPPKKDPAPSITQSTPDSVKPKLKPGPSAPPAGPQNRIIIADLLMVDGNFYIVRTERGEIQIEITPSTQLAEKFKFGDRIKAVVTPNDTALSVVRALAGEPNGVQIESVQSAPSPEKPPTNTETPTPKQERKAVPAPPGRKVIVADLLMVDGDFYVVRGELGEIRIEVTPETVLSEKFEFGDRIKAVVLPNDKAVSIERASP